MSQKQNIFLTGTELIPFQPVLEKNAFDNGLVESRCICADHPSLYIVIKIVIVKTIFAPAMTSSACSWYSF